MTSMLLIASVGGGGIRRGGSGQRGQHWRRTWSKYASAENVGAVRMRRPGGRLRLPVDPAWNQAELLPDSADVGKAARSRSSGVAHCVTHAPLGRHLRCPAPARDAIDRFQLSFAAIARRDVLFLRILAAADCVDHPADEFACHRPWIQSVICLKPFAAVPLLELDRAASLRDPPQVTFSGCMKPAAAPSSFMPCLSDD